MIHIPPEVQTAAGIPAAQTLQCSTTLLSIRRETGSPGWTLLSAAIPTAIGALLCLLINWLF